MVVTYDTVIDETNLRTNDCLTATSDRHSNLEGENNIDGIVSDCPRNTLGCQTTKNLPNSNRMKTTPLSFGRPGVWPHKDEGGWTGQRDLYRVG